MDKRSSVVCLIHVYQAFLFLLLWLIECFCFLYIYHKTLFQKRSTPRKDASTASLSVRIHTRKMLVLLGVLPLNLWRLKRPPVILDSNYASTLKYLMVGSLMTLCYSAPWDRLVLFQILMMRIFSIYYMVFLSINLYL